MHRLDRSYLGTPAGLVATGDVDPETKMRITVVLRPQARMDIMAPRLSRAEFRARHATSQEVVDRIAAYARNSRLAVEAADGANHVVRLTGSFAAAQAAFRPDHVQRFMWVGREYLCRSGHLWVPDDLAEHVVAVMGFDQRPVARPHFRIRPQTAASTVSYDPAAVAERYGFPSGVSGRGQTIALIELGGGFDASQMAKYFEEKGIKRTGSLAAVSVGAASTSPTGDSSGADGEVQLDIEVAGSVAPGANIIAYFGSNAGEGFFNTLSTAVHDDQHSPTVVSISWGGPESSWSGQDIDAMDQVLQTAAGLGITVCVASGDQGASDGIQDGTPTTDFPASSPHALGCGGTHLPRTGAEVAWNDGAEGGASGGGYSRSFARPTWQAGNNQTGRGVPDVSADADPATGYNVVVDGQDTVVGGTSAAAPLWAALIALVNEANGANAGFVNPKLYASSTAFNDVTKGNNDGYSCGPGWDPVTGLGTPKGDAIRAALSPSASASGSVTSS
jgi:kumamolisin